MDGWFKAVSFAECRRNWHAVFGLVIRFKGTNWGALKERISETRDYLQLSLRCLLNQSTDKTIRDNQCDSFPLLCLVYGYTVYLRFSEIVTQWKKERFSQWEFRGLEWDAEISTHGFRLNSTYCSRMDGSITSGCLLSKYNTRNPFPSGKDHRSEFKHSNPHSNTVV